MRTRAERRHHRDRIRARRERIVKMGWWDGDAIPPQVRHWHFRCNCFTCDAERRAERRRQARDWRRFEAIA